MPSPASPQGDAKEIAIIAALRQTRMFAELSQEDIRSVAAGCTIRNLAKGETLFRQGETAEGFYIARSGSVNVFRITPDGREQVICVFRAPESFAEVALATIEAYPANAVALEPSQIILVRRSHFRELLQKRPELSLLMLASMSMHLKHLVQSIQDIKGRQIEYRLADWLLSQAAQSGASEGDFLKLPVSKKVLAGQLGVTGETLSRTFARFKKEGLIELEGPNIRIADRPGLKAYLDA